MPVVSFDGRKVDASASPSKEPEKRAAELRAEIANLNDAIAALTRRKGIALREFRKILVRISARAAAGLGMALVAACGPGTMPGWQPLLVVEQAHAELESPVFVAREEAPPPF